jgi:hypothetical protein
LTLLSDLASAQGINANQAQFFLRIEGETTPRPVPGMSDKVSLHGIHVHVVELFDEFGLTPDVEIVEAVLPEPRQGLERIAERKFQLQGGCPPSRLAAQAARHALLQDLHDCGRGPLGGFAEEQVNVVGHDNVARERESVAVAHFAQNLCKQILRPRRGKQGQSSVATAGDEVKVVQSVSAFQSFRHR